MESLQATPVHKCVYGRIAVGDADGSVVRGSRVGNANGSADGVGVGACGVGAVGLMVDPVGGTVG